MPDRFTIKPSYGEQSLRHSGWNLIDTHTKEYLLFYSCRNHGNGFFARIAAGKERDKRNEAEDRIKRLALWVLNADHVPREIQVAAAKTAQERMLDRGEARQLKAASDRLQKPPPLGRGTYQSNHHRSKLRAAKAASREAQAAGL